MRTTLYSRLNPDVKARLEANQLDYSYTIGTLIAKLNTALFWNDLTVRNISNLLVFSDSDIPCNKLTMQIGQSNLI